MKSYPLLLGTVLLALSLSTSGCMVARNRTKRAETSASLTKAYSDYRVEMEKVNLERQKAGLQPSPVLSFEEWNKTKTSWR